MIRFILQGVLVSSLALTLSACNTSNSDAPAVNTVHQADWLVEHGVEAAGDIEGCKICHGVETAIAGSSVDACMSCHSTSPEVTTSGCVSCHGSVPSTGAHAAHNALSDVAGVCATCHEDAGSGTAVHFDGNADVSIDAIYDAMSGAAVYNTNGTCSNVSCHGGQDSPVMGSGTIDVNADCTSCHAFGAAQYNSYSSGRHSTHAGGYVGSCTVCHDVLALAANHFSGLDTAVFEGDPALTINSSLGYTKGNASCNFCHGARLW